MKKKTRTISGVTPVAVMTPPAGCPGECVYCPEFSGIPRSYTPHSPAVMRAASRNYDAVEQVKLRLKILEDMGHPTDKVELIIMGGTFLSNPPDVQTDYIKDCYDALNGSSSGSLEEAQQNNELAEHRAVGLCIETRPDYCGQVEIARMINWGTTRVELGVQMPDDRVYEQVKRGHDVVAVVEATRRLRTAGLKVHYHWMPGLPGSNTENDLRLTKMIFDNPDFRPDGLKLYPTMVVEGTELDEWYRSGRYRPYSDGMMVRLIADIKKLIPPYVRISRVLRDIPAEYINGGLKNSLRDKVRQLLEDEGAECRCVRCREYGHRSNRKLAIGTPELRRLDYEAAGGHEVFLSLEDDNETLFGLLRLRFQETIPAPLSPDGGPLGLIRELHVYGPEVGFGLTASDSVQHQGLGRRLISQAERIAVDEFGVSRMAVLSGVGVRNYYKSHGYLLSHPYMVKNLRPGTKTIDKISRLS
ncbi:Histone acetyltransferase [Dehalogenimonas lykanthroporepellens BL-DC-9]|nr:Histone acetyltransferase [Dehalogenimonas lykanthroporepellens BL-DC-9]